MHALVDNYLKETTVTHIMIFSVLLLFYKFVYLQRKQQRPSLSMSANPDVSAMADYPHTTLSPDGGHDTGGRTPRSGLQAQLTGSLLIVGWD